MRTKAQICKPIKVTLEIISYYLESSKAFISKLSSLTREQKQSGNFHYYSLTASHLCISSDEDFSSDQSE